MPEEARITSINGHRLLHFDLSNGGDTYHLEVVYNAWTGEVTNWTLNPYTQYGEECRQLAPLMAALISDIVTKDFEHWRALANA